MSTEGGGIAAPALGLIPKTAEGAVTLYDEWADGYDAALKSWDYPVPKRVAETLAELGVPLSGSVVDLGCGTGLSGEALRSFGFTGNLTGMDISQKSLNLIKKSKSNVYNALHVGNLDVPLDQLRNEPAPYDACISVGVFSYVEHFEVLFPQVVSLLKPGGVLVFSHNTVYWEEDHRGCRSSAEALEAQGAWKCERVGEPEPYMPANPDPKESSKRIRLIVYRKA